MPAFAHEYSASGAPVLFGTEKDQFLLALFTREDDLLGRTLHVYTSFAPLEHRIRRGLGEPLSCPRGTFTHSQDGHKINDALGQVHQPLQ